MADLTPLNPSDTWVGSDGRPTFEFYNWMQLITDAVNALPPLTGTGSPETVVVSAPGRWYVDTAAAVGAGIYYKETGDGNTGWVLRS